MGVPSFFYFNFYIFVAITKKVMKQTKEDKKPPKWFYIVLVLIPLLILILLELFLRLFNYGDDYNQWVKVTEEKYILNPDYTRKFFFATESVPYSNGNVFDINKKPGAFRIFILGGSSAAGFPYTPSGDFGKYIQKRLELLYPENRIEVVNLSITAVNSYTIRDLIPGVLEQSPDLIIIYAGHNEYYGALGAGSLEYVGSSRRIVNFVIYLNEFKLTQLVRNTLKWISGLFSSESSEGRGGTLMARMAKDQYIFYKSEVYKNGIEQFEGNLRDILTLTKDAGVPVLLSTLTSNLKDQPPFISEQSGGYPPAEDIYKKAVDAYERGNTREAESLYVYAKDLDGLRFRAPSEINNIIYGLAGEFEYPLTDIMSEFNMVSPGGITGNNIMTDHLHPDLRGYQLMGKLFFETMEKENILPEGRKNNIDALPADSITEKNFSFTRLDSTIARYRITILKNDWPFSEYKTGAQIAKLFEVKDNLDTLALMVVDNKLNWEEAHRRAAKIYLNRGDYLRFTNEMKVLIDQFPFIPGYSISVSETLLENKQYDLAYEILQQKYRYSPDAFSAKWIGIIELSKSNEDSSIKFLNESLKYNPADPQVLFNLAGAYIMKKDFKNALSAVEKCLQIEPGYRGAEELRRQLQQVL
jgi:tetratricopeptide (TPR) repeat protein